MLSGFPLYFILPPELASALSFLVAWSDILAPDETSASAIEEIKFPASIFEPEEASYTAVLPVPLMETFAPDEADTSTSSALSFILQLLYP